MPGVDTRLLAGLLSDKHGHAVFVLRDGSVHAANKAAVNLFRRDPLGLPLTALFDDTSVRKIERIFSTQPEAALTELQIEREHADPEAARFSVIATGNAEYVFIGSASGIAYPEQFGTRLMAANEETARLLRELSRDVQHARVARESLAELSSVRELFIAALAHDIRSPLNAILLTEAVLRKTAATATPQDLERHAFQVERNARSIVELIDSVLLAARLDAPSTEESMEALQIAEVARNWVETLEPVALQAGVALEFVCEASPTVNADRVRLGEVFSNLLSNAIRHSSEGTSVRLTIGVVDGRARCSVADRGPGVAPELRERIFDKFVQGGPMRGSTGLGLYIARRVVELHGGTLWVEDNVPNGARFVFELPIPETTAAA